MLRTNITVSLITGPGALLYIDMGAPHPYLSNGMLCYYAGAAPLHNVLRVGFSVTSKGRRPLDNSSIKFYNLMLLFSVTYVGAAPLHKRYL